MAAGTYDILIEQGATFVRKIIIRDGDGVLQNLTGHTFRGEVRKFASSTEILATFTCILSNQTTNRGEVTISLTSTQTAAILATQKSAVRKLTECSYDIERALPDFSVERILEGVVSVSPQVTL